MPPSVSRIGEGVYRVEEDVEGGSCAHIVYVAGSGGSVWAFWNGHIYRTAGASASADRITRPRGYARQLLAAPMPATVLKVLAAAGTEVKKGDTLVVLEAMKMELPIRATADGTIVAVHCREGEMVQADTVLVDLA